MASEQEFKDACMKALVAIAPCVVGWDDGVMPAWVEKLYSAVPDLQRVLDLPVTTLGPE